MRNIIEVINIMLANTPIGTEEADKFSNDLKKLRDSATYTAPEAIADCWLQGEQILTMNFGDYPKEYWQKRICSIWINKPIETIFSKQELEGNNGI